MKVFSNHPQKMSNQSEVRTDICRGASTPTDSFKLPSNNCNESSDATDSKGMRPTFEGFSLTTKQKLERSDHIASFPLTSKRHDRSDTTGLQLKSERAVRTNARSDRSSDPGGPRSNLKNKVHPADGFLCRHSAAWA